MVVVCLFFFSLFSSYCCCWPMQCVRLLWPWINAPMLRSMCNANCARGDVSHSVMLHTVERTFRMKKSYNHKTRGLKVSQKVQPLLLFLLHNNLTDVIPSFIQATKANEKYVFSLFWCVSVYVLWLRGRISYALWVICKHSSSTQFLRNSALCNWTVVKSEKSTPNDTEPSCEKCQTMWF